MNKNILFLENLYTLLDSGYSVYECLSICYDILHLSFIKKMQDSLNKGDDLSHLLINGPFPKMFKEYFTFYQNKHCLSLSIKKSINIYKMQSQFFNQLKQQLSYPILLLVFMLFFSIFIIFFLLPQVNQMFLSFQIERTLFLKIIFMLFHIIPLVVVFIISTFVVMGIHLYYGINSKKHAIIEFYLKIPIIQLFLRQYFSLKFCLYYHELALEGYDSATIIQLLNEQMVHNDLKIVLYEINTRLQDGEAIENVLKDFDYFEDLFLTFFEMYLKNPLAYQSLEYYIQLTYDRMKYRVNQIIKYLIPFIYGFVAVFVVTIYISIVLPMMNIISDL